MSRDSVRRHLRGSTPRLPQPISLLQRRHDRMQGRFRNRTKPLPPTLWVMP